MTVEKRVVHRLAVLQQNNAEVSASCFWYPGPTTDAPVRLNKLGFGLPDNPLDPLQPDLLSIFSLASVQKVPREFHCTFTTQVYAQQVPVSRLGVKLCAEPASLPL